MLANLPCRRLPSDDPHQIAALALPSLLARSCCCAACHHHGKQTPQPSTNTSEGNRTTTGGLRDDGRPSWHDVCHVYWVRFDGCSSLRYLPCGWIKGHVVILSLGVSPSHQLLDHNSISSCCSTASLATPGTHPQDSIVGRQFLQLANVQDALRRAPCLHTHLEPAV